MKADVLLGLQWGDEGKGKIVDVITPKYDVVARFQGGPNAGHTLHFDGKKFVLNTIPSGIFHEDCLNVIGNGVVIDPVILKREIENLENQGVPVRQRLQISRRAHLIQPLHPVLDAALEKAKGAEKIGSTLKGIGPAYQDKTGRHGIRMGDITFPDFLDRYHQARQRHLQMLSQLGYTDFDLEKLEANWLSAVDFLRQYPLIDSENLIHDAFADGKSVLAEGAQGTLLDLEFGTYPFVTSSNTITAGACTGLGIAPSQIGEVMGIFKAYCTRVGGGPFPTELDNEQGEKLRQLGHEFGATTGRARRTGWLDIPALKYAIRLNGATQLIMTKADVLSGFGKIQVCTHYQVNGTLTQDMPYDINEAVPVYQEFDGWIEDLTAASDYHHLPVNLKKYIEFIEQHLKVPITVVSVGPDRKQTLFRNAH